MAEAARRVVVAACVSALLAACGPTGDDPSTAAAPLDGSPLRCQPLVGEVIGDVVWSPSGQFLGVASTNDHVTTNIRVLAWPGMRETASISGTFVDGFSIAVDDLGSAYWLETEMDVDGIRIVGLEPGGGTRQVATTTSGLTGLRGSRAGFVMQSDDAGPPRRARLLLIEPGSVGGDPLPLTAWRPAMGPDFWVSGDGDWLMWSENVEIEGTPDVVLQHGDEERRIRLPENVDEPRGLSPSREQVVYREGRTGRLLLRSVDGTDREVVLMDRESHSADVSVAGVVASAPVANEVCTRGISDAVRRLE